MTRILLIGAGGFLGCRATRYLSSRHHCVGLTHHDLDLSSPDDICRRLEAYRPEWVILTAALSNTGYCAAHPDESERVNLWGTVNVARACRQTGTRLLYMSSDQVYNTCACGPMLTETQATAPQGPYAIHKLRAEQEVSALLPDAAVGLRLTWMYDDPASPLRASRHLLTQLAEARQTGQPLHLAVHDHRGLTDVWDVVRQLENCFSLPAGVYNFGCPNHLNAYETVWQAVAQSWGETEARRLVLPAEAPFAPQGRNLLMDPGKAAAHGIHFDDTLQALIQHLKP